MIIKKFIERDREREINFFFGVRKGGVFISVAVDVDVNANVIVTMAVGPLQIMSMQVTAGELAGSYVVWSIYRFGSPMEEAEGETA